MMPRIATRSSPREKGWLRMSTTERSQGKRERPKPAYNARAKVGNGWINIGAAWPLRSGEEGFSVKLTSIPIGFDGRFVLLPPLPGEEAPAQPGEE
jgi:hypothetical protein